MAKGEFGSGCFSRRSAAVTAVVRATVVALVGTRAATVVAALVTATGPRGGRFCGRAAFPLRLAALGARTALAGAAARPGRSPWRGRRSPRSGRSPRSASLAARRPPRASRPWRACRPRDGAGLGARPRSPRARRRLSRSLEPQAQLSVQALRRRASRRPLRRSLSLAFGRSHGLRQRSLHSCSETVASGASTATAPTSSSRRQPRRLGRRLLPERRPRPRPERPAARPPRRLDQRHGDGGAGPAVHRVAERFQDRGEILAGAADERGHGDGRRRSPRHRRHRPAARRG